MSIVEREAPAAEEPIDPAGEGPDRRSFLRIGALTAAGTAAAAVGGVATATRAEAANGGNFLIGQTNTGSNITELDGGSSLVVTDGNSYILGGSGNTYASVVGLQSDPGSAGLYGKDTSIDGTAIGVWGEGATGVLGRSNGAAGGAVGVKGQATSDADVAVEAQHESAGTALSAHSDSGIGASLESAAGTAAYLRSATGPALRFGPSSRSTVPPTTGTWTAGSVLMKAGALYYCWRSGTGTASRWARLSGALVPLTNPRRVYDSTKSGGAIAAGTARTVAVAKSGTSVPVGVSAALLSITVLRTAGSGYITAFSASSNAPRTRTLSWWGRKQTHTTTTVVRLNSSGRMKIKAVKNKTHVLVDVLGYYP
jgi:hypothetical protein